MISPLLSDALWNLIQPLLPPPSFRRFSTTAALSGTAGREHWRIWEWLAQMPCNRELRKARMPMPPAKNLAVLRAHNVSDVIRRSPVA